MEEIRRPCGRSRRPVVKVGSGVLSGGSGRLDLKVMRRLARELAVLKAEGREPLLVSSGAILAGRERLKLKAQPATTQLKQAAAAVGQSRLMRAWEQAFGREGLVVAQILLTRDDLRSRQRYLNARNTIFTLLRMGVVPIINENDTVAVEEIKFGDNDVLSALVASLSGADMLVLLTDQDGLYDVDPRSDPRASLIPVVEEGRAQARLGRAGPMGAGGMESKVRAARMAACAGIPAVIANGFTAGALRDALEGRPIGTLFVPRVSPLDKRRQWLAFASQPKGSIHVDEGAREALARGEKLAAAEAQIREWEARAKKAEAVLVETRKIPSHICVICGGMGTEEKPDVSGFIQAVQCTLLAAQAEEENG
ncbi:MAG: glutamate 5-kinase, partial [candidate division NC10 bacterium]